MFSNPVTTNHTFIAELWNGTSQVSGFAFAVKFLNAFTLMIYPSNVGTSTVNSGILTGPYTVRVVDINNSNATSPVYTNLTATIYFITKLNNPSITNLTIIYPKRIHI